MLRSLNLLFLVLLGSPLLFRYLIGHPIIPYDTSYAFMNSWGLEAWWIPPLLGVISFGVLWWILRKKETEKLFYALLLFVITPATITTFTSYSAATFIVPLALFAFLSPWTAWGFLSIMMFIDPVAGSFLCLAFALYFRHRLFSSLALAPLILLAVVNISLPVRSALFSEFGSNMGYSLFIVLLGAVAAIHSWKRINMLVVSAWAVAFGISAYVEPIRILVLIPLAVYAGSEIVRLLRRSWSLDFLKTASLILLACLALFVTISHTQTTIQAQPQESLIELFSPINEDSRNGALLVSPEIRSIAEYHVDREVVAIDLDDPLLKEVSITKIGPYLVENNARFLLLAEGEEGLFFLVNNNEKFIKIAQDQNYSLWLVLQEFV